MLFIKSIVCMLFMFNITIAHANKTAEKQTVDFIKNKTQREKIIETDKEARKSDDFVKQVMGKNSDDAYEAAADFMPYLTEIGNNDPEKMTEILNKAARDPAAFAESLPENLKNKIRALSLKTKNPSEPQKP